MTATNWPPPTDRAVPRGTRPPQPQPNYGPDQQHALATLLGANTLPTPAVTDSTVRGLPAAGFCVDLVANAVATMMVEAKVIDVAGEELDPRPPIVDCPNVLIDEFDFWYQLAAVLLTQGNYIALPADHDRDGYARQAVPVHPSAVSLDQSTGLPIYTVGELGEYEWDEIIHVAMKRPVGSFWGMGIVEQYRRHLKIPLHQQSYELNSFATGAIPSAVVTLDVNKVDGDVAKQVQDDWIERHGAGNRKPAVVPKTMSIAPLSWSPEDAQFIEARQLSIAECAYMCGLNPGDIGAVIATGGTTLTYENLSVRQLARLVDSYSPLMQRIERVWTRLTPGANKVRGNPEALQRMSTAERYALRKLAQEIGIETAKESRELEGRPPAPAGANPPPTPADPAPDPEEDDQ